MVLLVLLALAAAGEDHEEVDEEDEEMASGERDELEVKVIFGNAFVSHAFSLLSRNSTSDSVSLLLFLLVRRWLLSFLILKLLVVAE
jgi:hypothetical protein